MTETEKPGKVTEGDKTCIKALGLLSETGTGGNTTAVDVKNGKIIRIRPFH